MRIETIILFAAVVVAVAAQVGSGSYRFNTNRLNPVQGGRRRGRPGYLINAPGFGGNVRPIQRGRGPRRKLIKVVRRPEEKTETTNDVIGPASALKAGREGSYDFTDQHNAITPDKKFNKPTKPVRPAVATADSNKINIETRLTPATTQENDDATTERVNIGDTAIIHCTFDDVDQIGAYTQAKIWWTKLSESSQARPVIMAAGTQVRLPDDRLRVVTFPDNSFSILIIKDALPEDAGEYKCSLPTVTGTVTRFTTLQVDAPQGDTISISAKETSLSSGDTLNLFCKPQNPRINVWWTAKDADGNNIDVTRGFDRVAGRTLTIPNIQRNQAGIFTCHVEEGVGSPVRRHFTVTVKERPWEIQAFIGGFQLTSIISQHAKSPVYGDDVHLRCDTGGEPIPEVTWYKDGRQISNSYKYSVSSYEPSYRVNSVVSKLSIRNFQRYDEGEYSCKAQNEAGSQQQDFNIQGSEDEQDSVQSDDEDINRAALTGRRGQLRIVKCKGGQPCRSQTSSNSYPSLPAYSIVGDVGSGDDE